MATNELVDVPSALLHVRPDAGEDGGGDRAAGAVGAGAEQAGRPHGQGHAAAPGPGRGQRRPLPAHHGGCRSPLINIIISN